jgi:hypothetical protein
MTVTDPAIGKRKELVAGKQTRATAKWIICYPVTVHLQLTRL